MLDDENDLDTLYKEQKSLPCDMQRLKIDKIK